jgi:hypothetical protein
MTNKVSDFMRDLTERKERDTLDSSLGKNLNEPLLDEYAEGGSPHRGNKSLRDLASGEISSSSKEGYGSPEKIVLQDTDIKFLNDRSNRVKSNQIHYEFFKQSFFDIPVQSFEG